MVNLLPITGKLCSDETFTNHALLLIIYLNSLDNRTLHILLHHSNIRRGVVKRELLSLSWYGGFDLWHVHLQCT